MRASAAPLLALVLALMPAGTALAAGREPIIDMHLHADMRTRQRPVAACPGDQPILMLAVDPVRAPAAPTISCPRPIWSAQSADELRRRTIAELKRLGVVRSVLAGPPSVVAQWRADWPGHLIAAGLPDNLQPAGIAGLRALATSGRVQLFAEVSAQYQGMRADDPRAEPFWALAEELDVPVGIHLGDGMPLAGKSARDPYRASLTSPFQLEAVIKKHPRLRIYVMHAASPLIDEMLAMLFTYPSLYVDISANVWNMPRAQFYGELRKLVEAGFGQRILFGSDQTIFPQAVGLAIQSIEQAPFLTKAQKRDILYNNAARFLRLTPAEIAADHAAAR